MGLLDNNRTLPVGSSVLTSNESVSLATANTAVKTIPGKKGFRCVCIYLSTDATTAALSIRQGSSSRIKMMVTEDGELHYRIDYYNNLSALGGTQGKRYYIQTTGEEELRLFNITAVTGGTATITVTYLQDFPEELMSLKPRQILHRQTKTFGASDTQFNQNLSTNIKDSEVYALLRLFKYVSVEMLFLNSSNAKKFVTGTFRLNAMCYLPLENSTTSAPYLASDEILIDKAISNVQTFATDWVEAKGYSLRFEINLGQTISEGDKAIINIIGIR